MQAAAVPSATWSYPNEFRFGAGRIAELGEAVAATGMRRPLLVTDRGLAGLPITARALSVLEEAGLGQAMFSEVDANPNERNLAEGLAAFRAGGHDGVVAFGGGSGLDLAKLIAFMEGQSVEVWEFEDLGDLWKKADAGAIHPIVAVPTTAGTGSEVGRAAVLTNTATHVKKVIFHPRMLPRLVIADPELTVGMPPAITAGTGMDALAHCLEAYVAPNYHPMSAGVGLEGMRLVREYLPRAVADGTDLEARAQMMAAAAMGAVAFQKGLGAVHSLSHPAGSLYGAHHGTANAVVMPAVMRFNRPAIEPLVERAAAYLGIAGGFDGVVGWIEDLNGSIGIPERLGGLGVGRDRIGEMAAMAIVDPTAAHNPVELTLEAATRLYEDTI